MANTDYTGMKCTRHCIYTDYTKPTGITATKEFSKQNSFQIQILTNNKNNYCTQNSTNMLVVQAGPRLLSNSLSLDVIQFSSSSWASVVSSGAITREASWPDDMPGSISLLHASTISDKGSNRKCTSSGALGSRMFPFNRAYNQQKHYMKNPFISKYFNSIS